MHKTLAILADQISAAQADRSALRIRGAGSKDFYGESLRGDILDTRVLHGVISYEPSELVVTARAGTPLLELEQTLAGNGQHLAFEPPHFAPGATVGGMVAAGLSGPSRAASGGVRDFVLGVQMINGRAQWLNFGGQVMKNVAGYDVSRLMVGALGTLGVLTAVSLKVLPIPPAQATLVFALEQAAALCQLNAWAGQPLPLNASCWAMEKGHGRLTLRLRGAAAAVQAACRDLGGERLDDADAQRHWAALREQTLAFFERAADQCLWRLSVPDSVGALPLAPDSTLIEWGGALRWVKAPAQQAAALRKAVVALGGTATLFRQPALSPAARPAVFHPLAAPLQRIHRDLKAQFDPHGIFNPARMFADI